MDNIYNEEYPPLPNNTQDTCVDDPNLISSTTNVKEISEAIERKILNIPERSVPSNVNDFYQLLARDVKKFGANISLSRMPSGSYNLAVKCPSCHMRDVIGIIRLHVEGKVSRSVNVDKDVLSKLKENNTKLLYSCLSPFNDRVGVVMEEDSLILSGVSVDVDEAICILKQTVEKLKISDHRSLSYIHPKFFPLIRGHFDVNIKQVLEMCLKPVSICFPPVDSGSWEITINGLTPDVATVCTFIEEKYKECMNYPETALPLASQFRENITRVSGIDKILKETGVAVYISPDKNEKRVLLIGHEDKLADAIPVVVNRAKHYAVKDVSCPKWVYNILKDIPEYSIVNLKRRYMEVWFSYMSNKEVILIDGPVSQVDLLEKMIAAKAEQIATDHSFTIVQYPSTFLLYLKSRGVLELNQLVSNHQCRVDLGDVSSNKIFPFNSNLQMHLFGDKSGIDEANTLVSDYISDLKRDFSFEVEYDSLFATYVQNLCCNNSVLDEIKNRFGSVVKSSIKYVKSKRVTVLLLQGNKGSVFSVDVYIEDLLEQVKKTHMLRDLGIPKAYHYLIIGRGGTVRNKIIADSGVEKLIIPSSEEVGPGGNVVTLFGLRDCVDEAEKIIFSICDIDVELDEIEIDLPSQFCSQLKMCNSLVLRRLVANLIKQKSEHVGTIDVNVILPGTIGNSNKTKVRGCKKLVDIVSSGFLKLSKANSLIIEPINIEEIHYKSVIGRNGTNLQKLTDNSKAEIIIPPIGKRNIEDKAIIMGFNKNDVQKLKEKLLKFVQELKDIKETRVKIPVRYFKRLVSKNGDEDSLLTYYQNQYSSVKIIFPKDEHGEEYVLRGPSKFVEELRKELIDRVSYWDKVVLETIPVSQDHLTCMRNNEGNMLDTIMSEFNVSIKVKRDRESNDEESKFALIIEGLPADVERTKQKIQDNKPIQDTLDIPKRFHSVIIGSKGSGLKKLLEGLGISLIFPPNEVVSETVQMSGPANQIEEFKQRLTPLLEKIKNKQTDWESKNQMIELEIDPKWYSKLIGKGGSFITGLKEKYKVNILIPGSSNNSRVLLLDHKHVTIKGELNNLRLAETRILELVKQWEDIEETVIDVPKELHGRLRGTKSANIRALQKKYNVEVRFAPQERVEDNSITIRGSGVNVKSAGEEILEIAMRFKLDDEVANEDSEFSVPKQTLQDFKFANQNTVLVSKKGASNVGLRALQGVYKSESLGVGQDDFCDNGELDRFFPGLE